MKVAKGADYDRLLAEFISAGGDLSLCPFDTEDYKYENPPYKIKPHNVLKKDDCGESTAS